MTTPPIDYAAVISAPEPQPTDLVFAHYDADTDEIVVSFRDNKIARVPTTEFEELATATTADYEQLDGTRAGVTCITETVDFAVGADWWREQAKAIGAERISSEEEYTTDDTNSSERLLISDDGKRTLDAIFSDPIWNDIPAKHVVKLIKELGGYTDQDKKRGFWRLAISTNEGNRRIIIFPNRPKYASEELIQDLKHIFVSLNVTPETVQNIKTSEQIEQFRQHLERYISLQII